MTKAVAIKAEANTEDGGYYALKGFSFQIDKAILEIIESEDNQEIGVEKIQDIDSDDFVIQVKYKETQSYSNLKIREPVLQLIEEFSFYPEKNISFIAILMTKKKKIKF